MIASPPNTPFSPDDALAAAILRDLTSSRHSLAAVANAHGVSIADLALWLDSPDARQRIAAIERGSYVAVRLAATINLPAAVDALTQILTDFRALAKSGIDHTDPVYLRAAIHARKAALQLCRLSRAVPIDESHIKDMLSAARLRTASVNERTSPPQRTASVSRVACLRGEQACASTPAPDLSSSPSAPMPLRPSAPVSRSPSAPAPLRPSAPVSSSPVPSSPFKLGDSFAERTPQPSSRGGPQDRRGLLPADLIRAATGPPIPLGSSP